MEPLPCVRRGVKVWPRTCHDRAGNPMPNLNGRVSALTHSRRNGRACGPPPRPAVHRAHSGVLRVTAGGAYPLCCDPSAPSDRWLASHGSTPPDDSATSAPDVQPPWLSSDGMNGSPSRPGLVWDSASISRVRCPLVAHPHALLVHLAGSHERALRCPYPGSARDLHTPGSSSRSHRHARRRLCRQLARICWRGARCGHRAA